MLPDPEVAYQILFDRVHQQAFFDKLAAYNLVPEDVQEARGYLEIAGQLRAAHEQALVKQAAELGYWPVQPIDWATKQAAAKLAQDPAIYNAVLSLKALEAASVQASLANG